VAGRWLLAAAAVTQFIAWAPIQGVPGWLGRILPASMQSGLKNFGMPNGLDEQYTWMSVAILVAFAMIAWDMMAAREAALAPAAGGPALAPAGAAPAPALPEKQQATEGGKEDSGRDGGGGPNRGRQRGRRTKRR
jgi:hypothetical protein